MRNTLRLASFLVVSALISCSGSCGKGDRFGAPGEPEARKLEPLPAAPKLDVAQDQLASGPLTVVAALPTGETRGEVRPTITFSKPVKTLEAIEEGKDTPFPGKLTPNVPGEWRWLGSASVEFVPQGTLPYATEFQVVVPKGVARNRRQHPRGRLQLRVLDPAARAPGDGADAGLPLAHARGEGHAHLQPAGGERRGRARRALPGRRQARRREGPLPGLGRRGAPQAGPGREPLDAAASARSRRRSATRTSRPGTRSSPRRSSRSAARCR